MKYQAKQDLLVRYEIGIPGAVRAIAEEAFPVPKDQIVDHRHAEFVAKCLGVELEEIFTEVEQ